MTAQASLVTGVDFVTIDVTDLTASRRFYGEVLGLEAGPLWQRGDQPAMGAEFETGTVTLSLIDPKALGRDFQAGRQAIAFRVDDVHAAREALEAQGVHFNGDVIDSGVCHMAFFTDPDGNALMLHHRYAPREG